VRLIYCCDPTLPARIDEAFAHEAAAASAAGLAYSTVSYEAIVGGDLTGALRRVQAGAELALYRGWMLTPSQYQQLHDGLSARGLRLINEPAQYRYAHWFPENYPDIEAFTPQSVCIPRAELDWNRLPERLALFGDRPLIVKDWVKSRKHEWDEACFIPSAADGAAVERIARRFIALQGDDWVGGLVFRAFESFAPLGTHAQSGMPLTKEFRIFYIDGLPIFDAPYWEGGDYGTLRAPTAQLDAVAGRLRSRFFSLDVALRSDGVWRIVEMGDGQVSGLPDEVSAAPFYRGLAAAGSRLA
jgi:ATP-grasp domain, R2K clade family 3